MMKEWLVCNIQESSRKTPRYDILYLFVLAYKHTYVQYSTFLFPLLCSRPKIYTGLVGAMIVSNRY